MQIEVCRKTNIFFQVVKTKKFASQQGTEIEVGSLSINPFVRTRQEILIEGGQLSTNELLVVIGYGQFKIAC